MNCSTAKNPRTVFNYYYYWFNHWLLRVTARAQCSPSWLWSRYHDCRLCAGRCTVYLKSQLFVILESLICLYFQDSKQDSLQDYVLGVAQFIWNPNYNPTVYIASFICNSWKLNLPFFTNSNQDFDCSKCLSSINIGPTVLTNDFISTY